MRKQIFPDTVQEDEPIWRYVPLHTLFFYLNGLVFIPSIAKLREGDPFEGVFYKNLALFNDAFERRYGDEAKKIEKWILDNDCSGLKRDQIECYPGGASGFHRDRYLEFVWKTRFAWCWFRSCRESAAMWSAYGKNGAVIMTTVARVAAVLKAQDLKFICEPMNYVDYRTGTSTEFNPEIESDVHLRPFFLKRDEYESEHEIRFITAAAKRKPERGGILLSGVNPQDWISAIRLWPKFKTAESQALCETIKSFLPKVDCSISDLCLGSPGESGLLEDLMADLERQSDLAWKINQDGIPRLLKEL